MEHHNNKRESQKADSRKTALPPQTQIGATQENAWNLLRLAGKGLGA